MRIDVYAGELEAGGAITPELRAAARARITLTSDLASAAADADLLSEAVPEDPELKGRVLSEWSAACPRARSSPPTRRLSSRRSSRRRRDGRTSAAISLAQQGVASIEDIDRAWMHITKAPVGPLGALDAVGLDTVWTITDYWARWLGDEQLRANATFLKDYVDRSELGVKTGRGFYAYPNPAYARPGFVEQPDSPEP